MLLRFALQAPNRSRLPPEWRCIGCGTPMETSNPQRRYCADAFRHRTMSSYSKYCGKVLNQIPQVRHKSRPFLMSFRVSTQQTQK